MEQNSFKIPQKLVLCVIYFVAMLCLVKCRYFCCYKWGTKSYEIFIEKRYLKFIQLATFIKLAIIDLVVNLLKRYSDTRNKVSTLARRFYSLKT